MTIRIFAYTPQVGTQWCSLHPQASVLSAMQLTHDARYAGYGNVKNENQALLEDVIAAGHTSILEHTVISFFINQVSRATLDQLARHRIAAITMSSTHYEDHSSFPLYVSHMLLKDKHALDTLAQQMATYRKIKNGSPHAEARQLLPLSIGAACMFTINARSLINLLRIRMCARNTIEMAMLAQEMYHVACGWWPMLKSIALPACLRDEPCPEGPFHCKDPDKALILEAQGCRGQCVEL